MGLILESMQAHGRSSLPTVGFRVSNVAAQMKHPKSSMWLLYYV